VMMLLPCNTQAGQEPVVLEGGKGTSGSLGSSPPPPPAGNTQPQGNTKTQFSNRIEEEEVAQIPEDLTEEGEEGEEGENSSALVKLTGSNFSRVVSRPGYTFIKFFAPWCGHCQAMQGDWQLLAEYFKASPVPGKSVTIAEIDCTAILDSSYLTCSQEAVVGYPTIRLYKDNNLVADYHYARSFHRMKRFLHDQFFDLSKLEPDHLGVFKLDQISFQSVIESSGETPIVVFFSLKSCPKCAELKAAWEKNSDDVRHGGS